LPIYLTAETNEVGSIWNDSTYFDESQEFITKIIRDTDGGINTTSALGISWLGEPLPFWLASIINAVPDLVPDYQFVKNATWKQLDSSEAATTLMFTSFNPAAAEFSDFSEKLRNSVADFLASPRHFHWTLGGLEIQVHDLSDKAYQRFPLMLGITVGVICLFVGVAMRSVIVPIRLVISVGWTVAWTFGLQGLVFTVGIFDWISPWISGHQGNDYWIVALMMTTIVIGLGCDYDVFLFTRITELRAEGKTTDEAIREGYYHTGEVITGAGLVMAIAFSGLAASGMPTLRQIGVFLATSVLLDTFVVRMLMVPPILHFLGRFNWWPNQLYRTDGYQPIPD
jgi:uncharacterized membrane protein YdfJ with MMPL/SSD domain